MYSYSPVESNTGKESGQNDSVNEFLEAKGLCNSSPVASKTRTKRPGGTSSEPLGKIGNEFLSDPKGKKQQITGISSEFIKKNITFLLQHLRPDKIIDDLRKLGVFTEGEITKLDSHKERKKAVKFLLETILEKPEAVIRKFIDCLSRDHQLSNIFRNELDTELPDPVSGDPGRVGLTPLEIVDGDQESVLLPPPRT